MRLLVVDDEPDCLWVVARLLRLGGWPDVEVAHSVGEALSRPQPDLLIADWSLPDGTGGQLLALLRERRPLRSILLSGWPPAEVDAAGAGFDVHLMKPVDFDRLCRTIIGLAG